MHENDICMLENKITMHENENFAPGVIFLALEMFMGNTIPGDAWKSQP